MKKVVIAIFFAIMMLLVPISAVSKTTNNLPNIVEDGNDDSPTMYLTEGEYSILDQYIDNNLEGEDYSLAVDILTNVATYDAEYELYIVDMEELADALDIYGYNQPIPDELLTEENIDSKSELFDLINQYWLSQSSTLKDFVRKIIELLEPRLGWMYELVSRGAELFVNGVNLAIDFINLIQNIDWAIKFAILFNLIVSIPLSYFSESLRELFSLNFSGFINKISDFTGAFTDELNNLVDGIQDILDLLGPAFDDIKDYVAEIGDFVDWIRGDGDYSISPWEQDINVKGVAVTLSGEPHVGLEVACRGVTAITDGQGLYKFTVEPSGDSETSKPAKSWYGLHDCTISISKDGEVKQRSIGILSYVFSGGEISWPFIVVKVRSRLSDIHTFLLEKFDAFFERLISLLPIFSQNL